MPSLDMFIDDSLFLFAGGQIGVPDEERDFVGFVEIFPQFGGTCVDILRDGDPFRLTLEGGDKTPSRHSTWASALISHFKQDFSSHLKHKLWKYVTS